MVSACGGSSKHVEDLERLARVPRPCEQQTTVTGQKIPRTPGKKLQGGRQVLSCSCRTKVISSQRLGSVHAGHESQRSQLADHPLSMPQPRTGRLRHALMLSSELSISLSLLISLLCLSRSPSPDLFDLVHAILPCLDIGRPLLGVLEHGHQGIHGSSGAKCGGDQKWKRGALGQPCKTCSHASLSSLEDTG